MRFMSFLSFGWTFIVRWCPSKRPENFVHVQTFFSPETDSEIRPLSDGCAFCPVCVLYLVVFHTFPSARRPAGSVAAGDGTDGTGIYSTSNAYTPHSHSTPAGCLQDDYRSKRMYLRMTNGQDGHNWWLQLASDSISTAHPQYMHRTWNWCLTNM